MLTIDQIEDAIIARLEDQILYLRTCASMAEYTDEETEGLTKLYPAAYVVYTEGTYTHMIEAVQDRSMIFTVRCVTKNIRGREGARRGSDYEKGMYELLEDVRDALSGQMCGLGIHPLMPIRERAVKGGINRAEYDLSFQTRCRDFL